MAKVRVGSQFFKRSREEYRNWRMAVIREMAQNSQDALSANIFITTESLGVNGSRMIWKDDGRGMDRATLENVFFALGESSKGKGETGGFGKARELTCFSMDRYSIRTANLSVEGSGDEYEIEETEEFVGGCCFELDMDIDVNILNQNIESYFSYSNPLCHIFLNDKKVKGFAKIGQHRRDLSFAKVHVNEKDKTNRCIIRVNGLYMYERYISADASVYVELDPIRSKTLLTSNRDGMSGYEVNGELDSFFGELSADVTSALRKRLNIKTGLIKGARGLSISQKKQESALLGIASGAGIGAGLTMPCLTSINVQKHQTFELDFANPAVLNDFVDFSHIYIIDETDLDPSFAKMRLVRDKYDPRNWRTAYVMDKYTGEQRPYNIGGNIKKLLVLWKVACASCLEILQEFQDIGTVRWSVGWLFCNDRMACCSEQEIDNKRAVFYCLRPVNMDGKMAYSLSDKDDWHKLVWLALHEVLHTSLTMHDEKFASMLTHLSPKISSQMGEIFKQMAAAIKGV